MNHRSKSKSPSKGTKKSAKKRASRFSAKTADKHVLYQLSVQAPEIEVDFFTSTYKALRKKAPLTMREDFCGTALLCAAWVKGNKARTATGVDLDRPTLDWGIEHNLQPLGEAMSRITLLQQDVRQTTKERFDVINAMNFSYWVFKTRADMKGYFASVQRSLKKDGVFICDAYGGWEAQEPMFEPRRVKGGFTYVWDQDVFCPITHDIVNHIHFEFKDGSKLNKAFTYEWRYWSLPELQELLKEAGFKQVQVYWDVATSADDENYRPRRRAENQAGWLAYLVASK